MTVSTIYKLAAEMTTRGNLASGVTAANKQLRQMHGNLGHVNSTVANIGRTVGSGAFQTAAAVTRGAAAAGAVAVAAATAMTAKSGLQAVINMERMRSTLAGTLQLYNHSAGAADQIGQNVKVATQAMRELQVIADSSPGELQDVSKMFENMLPGARSVTGDMRRILDLTRNLALFTPTLTGGDFITSGSQMGRILTGSAGAEMDTWKRLSPVIADVGSKMKSASGSGKLLAEGLGGDKLTAAFNQLTGEDRLRLVEEAFTRGGPELAAMYAESWEGASAAAMSSLKRVRNAAMMPIFEKIKAAAISNTHGDPDGTLGQARTEKMIMVATSVGALMAGPVERALAKLSSGMRYIQENTYSVVNRIYQGFQVAGAVIRGAAAFMLSRMMIGAGLMAAAATGRAIGGAGRAAKGAFDMTRGAGQGIAVAATATRNFFKTFTGGGPVSNALGLFTAIGTGFGKMAMFAAVLVPTIIIAAAAFALLAIPLVAAAGIAAYAASKWRELSDSVVQGLHNGTVTLRPLVIAALIFWERLKQIGEAFIGGKDGASMMQSAINMAASAVYGLAEGVAIMANIAAGMLTIIGKLANAYDAVFGESDDDRRMKRAVELNRDGMSWRDALQESQSELEFGMHRGGPTFGDDALQLADKLTEAAKAWRATDIKSINEAEISSWTDSLTTSIADFFSKNDEKKPPKGPRVSVQNLYQNIDLRGEDPDRALSALITPIENLARRPTSSSSDMVGGMG